MLPVFFVMSGMFWKEKIQRISRKINSVKPLLKALKFKNFSYKFILTGKWQEDSLAKGLLQFVELKFFFLD